MKKIKNAIVLNALFILFAFFIFNSNIFAAPIKNTSQEELKKEQKPHQPFDPIVNTQEHQVKNQDLWDYCSKIYNKKVLCPKDVCVSSFKVNQQGIGYVMRCEPKTCLSLDAQNCPTDTCQIMKGCGGDDVCFPRDERKPPVCGGLAYEGQDVECCPGFVKRCGVEFFDGSCGMKGKYSVYGVPICLPCGNGICNQFENRCNCPEDCK